MKKPSDNEDLWNREREKIIGLGEKSIRKSYYPELQQKIRELEKANQHLEQEIEERHRAEEEIKKNYENKRVSNTLLKISLTSIPLEELFRITIDNILSLDWISKDGKVSIYFVEDAPEVLILKAEKHIPEQLLKSCDRVAFGQCMCGLAASTGKTQFCDHIDERHVFGHEHMPDHGHYCAPIVLNDRSIGVICVYLPQGHRYDRKEEEALTAIADTLAGIIQRDLITIEKNKLMSQLRQSQKMEAIGTLAGGIAHDFNNILTSVMGYAELALTDIERPEKIRRDVYEIVKGANRAKDLVKQILAFSRRSDQQLSPLRFRMVAKEVINLLRSSIPATIEISQDIRSDETVMADPTEIHQLIMNLCTNAYQAMKEKGGTLSISLHTIDAPGSAPEEMNELEPGKYLRLTVSDTGVGMTEEIQERIFEPYFTTKKKEEGTGLGMAVVHGIVSRLRGMISVSSEPGRGTTFNVYLPVLKTPAAKNRENSEALAPRGRGHILVVDDDASIARLLQTCWPVSVIR